MKAQINEFGQTPKQIFTKPHVQKRSKVIMNKELGFSANSKNSKNSNEQPSPRINSRKSSARKDEDSSLNGEKNQKQLEEENDDILKKIDSMNLDSLNDISDEISGLIGEARENLTTEEPKREEPIDRMDTQDEKNNLDYMDILEEVEKMLPEEQPPNKIKNDDAYFNFVSSKSFDLKRDHSFKNNK